MRAETRNILRERDAEMDRARREAIKQKARMAKAQQKAKDDDAAMMARMRCEWSPAFGPFNPIRGL